LEKEIKNLENLVSKNSVLLKNKKFLLSAPKEIIAKNKNKLEEYKKMLRTQEELLNNLG